MTLHLLLTTHSQFLSHYAIKRAEQHIFVVSQERDYYRELCKDCREKLKAIFCQDNVFCPPPTTLSFTAMSLDCKVHYSFDMAQQVSDTSQ